MNKKFGYSELAEIPHAALTLEIFKRR